MANLIAIWKKIRSYLNLYQIIILVFGLYIVFLDENNLIHRSQLNQQQEELKEQVQYYKEKIAADVKALEELESNDENLERYAREHYLMKQPNEEIFILK